jgi:hypothetical protein
MSQAGKIIAGSGAGGIETITGTSGGAVGPDAGFNLNLLGSGGVTVSGNAGTNTLTINVSGSGYVWNNVTLTAAAMTTDNGYVANNAGLVTLTLPATAAFGTSLAVIGLGAGGWIIAQNAGQTIHIGSTQSSVGAGGSVASTNRYDSLEMICTVANTTWSILGGGQGTFTVV